MHGLDCRSLHRIGDGSAGVIFTPCFKWRYLHRSIGLLGEALMVIHEATAATRVQNLVGSRI